MTCPRGPGSAPPTCALVTAGPERSSMRRGPCEVNVILAEHFRPLFAATRIVASTGFLQV